MRAFLEAATGFPALLFTAALVVVVGFWVLVAFGAAGSDSFDSPVDPTGVESARPGIGDEVIEQDEPLAGASRFGRQVIPWGLRKSNGVSMP